MKSEVIDNSQIRKEIKIEIDGETVRRTYDEISSRYAKAVNVPGFRPGHAPVSVIKTRYKDDIRSEVLRELVPDSITAAIEEHKLEVIGEPDVHLENSEGLKMNGSEPISLHVHVEVMPDIALGAYKELEVERRVRPVTDELVDEAIEHLRQNSASLEAVEDRGAEVGDTVTVDLLGTFFDSPDAEPIKVDDVDIELGGGKVQQEFSDNLLGVKADEEKSFTVAYPEDFSSTGLAGKTVDYIAKVLAVRRLALPDIDDEFVKSLDTEGVTNVDELRARVRSDFEERHGLDADNLVRADLIKQMVDAHELEVPMAFIQHQTGQLVDNFARELAGRGIDPRGQDESFWRMVGAQMQPQAEQDVRGMLLIERIAEEEKIEVSDDEVAAEIERLAEATGQSVEQVRATLTKNEGERSIANRLRSRKALDLVVENARVTEGEWREPEPPAAAEESAAEPEAKSIDQTADEEENATSAEATSSTT
ncbi:MAG: trigger factor [Pyrinomonadaceae bacterium]